MEEGSWSFVLQPLCFPALLFEYARKSPASSKDTGYRYGLVFVAAERESCSDLRFVSYSGSGVENVNGERKIHLSNNR